MVTQHFRQIRPLTKEWPRESVRLTLSVVATNETKISNRNSYQPVLRESPDSHTAEGMSVNLSSALPKRFNVSVLFVCWSCASRGYSFCVTCVKRVQEDKKPCPTCNEANFNVFFNKGLKRSLYEFRVYCCQRGEGCDWVGELGELDRHLNLQPPPEKLLVGCQFSELDCTYCVQPFQRCYVQAHQLHDCPKRPYACQHCNKYAATFKATYEEVTQNHWPVCPFFPLSCPNNCELVLQRQEVEHHMSRDCPFTLVLCDFHMVGCQARLTRTDMPSHISENLTGHMSLLQAHMMTHPGENMATYLWLMVGSIQKVVLDNANIRSELHEAQETLRDTRDELQETHDELQGTRETVAELEASGVSQQEQIENLQQEIDVCQEENKTLQQQKDDLTERLRASEQRIQALDTQLAAVNDEKKQLHHKLQETEVTMAQLEKIVTSQDERIAIQAKKVEECSTQVEQHQHNTTLVYRELQEKIQQSSTQLQATVTAHEKKTTAALNQHKRESDKKMRAANDELSKKLTASDHRTQTALNAQQAAPTQQKHELTEKLSTSEQKMQALDTGLQEKIQQTSTQLQKIVTAQKDTTAALNQHKRESDDKLRAAREELSKNLTASEHQIQTALDTQMTQQKHELAERLSASEQRIQTQVGVLAQTSTQLQATVTAHKKETTAAQHTLDQHKRESNEKLRAAESKLSMKLTASEQRMQMSLNTQQATLTQQKNELTEKLSASEQTLQATLATQQTTITKCRDENRRLQQSLTEQERKQLESEAELKRVKDDLTRKITASEQKIQTQETTLNQHQKTLEKVTCTGTLPFEFTMTEFEKHKTASDKWYSPPFYTHTHGYRMCIRVDANGYGSGKGTHMSIYTCIMRGPFDGDLKWPFRGDVTIQIVNQAGEDSHQERVIHYTDETPDRSAGRVTDEERSGGRGFSEFLPHSSLGNNAASNTQYLRGDSLRIRISKVKLKN